METSGKKGSWAFGSGSKVEEESVGGGGNCNLQFTHRRVLVQFRHGAINGAGRPRRAGQDETGQRR